MTNTKESYKIQARDLIPFTGLVYYVFRHIDDKVRRMKMGIIDNQDVDKEYNKRLGPLGTYHIITTIGLLGTTMVVGLEKLLK